MANIKSQLKRIKTNEKATERNKAVKSELRTGSASSARRPTPATRPTAQDALKTASTKLDKAV